MFNVSNQQFFFWGPNRSRFVQVQMASGTVLWMDQAASADKEIQILRYFWNRRKNANLNRYLRLYAGCHHEEALKIETEPLQNFTDFKYYSFWKNPYFMGFHRKVLPKPSYFWLYPTEFIRSLTGHWWCIVDRWLLCYTHWDRSCIFSLLLLHVLDKS